MMDTAEVIELARRYALQHGYDIDQYEASATCEQHTWQVHFRSRRAKPGPGEFFTVYIDERDKTATKLLPGK